MGIIQIKVDDDLHLQLKRRALETRETLHAIVILALQRYIKDTQDKKQKTP